MAAASFQSLISAGLNQRPPLTGGTSEYHSLLASLAISASTTNASDATSHTATPSSGSAPSPSPTLAQEVGEEKNVNDEEETNKAEEMEAGKKSTMTAEGTT